MRRFLTVFCLLFSSMALGQQTQKAITSNQCATFNNISNSISSVAIQVVGTWTGTLQPQAGVQTQTPQPVQVFPSTSPQMPQSTIVPSGTNALYFANVPAASVFSVCGNTVASGTATVYMNASTGVFVAGNFPVTVFKQAVIGQSITSGAYSTVYTTPAAGVYRLTGRLYPTTVSTTAFVVELAGGAIEVNSIYSVATSANNLSQSTIGTTVAGVSQGPGAVDFNLSAGATIQVATFTLSGSNTGGVWNYVIIIERIA